MTNAGDPKRLDATTPNGEEARPSDALAELDRLRELLFGHERRRLGELEERLDTLEPTAEQVANVLPEAVSLRTGDDRQLARSLAPTIESSIDESVYRNPDAIAEAIYPTLGPAIRKAIAQTMSGFVGTLNRAIEHSLSWRGLKWRLEAWRTGVPFAEVVIRHALVYQVEQVFLIHHETGLLLAHALTDTSKAKDADLVSAMLTAITDFVSDSFDASDEGGLRDFSVGERTVFVEAGPAALLAAVVQGQAPASLFERLQGALETIHLQFRGPLGEFEGDASRFQGAQPILEDCLETVVGKDRRKSRGAAPWIAWTAAAALALALILLGVRSQLRWRRAVNLLRVQPGIVLIEAERGWWEWRLSGLRDPLAVDPLGLLAENGVDAARVESDWRPYLSMEPEILVRRAEGILAPPGGVTLSSEDNLLRAAGSAPPAWISRASQIAVAMHGVEAVDFSALQPQATPVLAEAEAELERIRVLFELGSSSLVAGSSETFAEAAESAARLVEVATDEGWTVDLHLVGRSDATGTEDSNRLLSEERSIVVREALELLGIPLGSITTEGIGITDPVTANEPARQAQLNRSVSFSVRLRTEGVKEE